MIDYQNVAGFNITWFPIGQAAVPAQGVPGKGTPNLITSRTGRAVRHVSSLLDVYSTQDSQGVLKTTLFPPSADPIQQFKLKWAILFRG